VLVHTIMMLLAKERAIADYRAAGIAATEVALFESQVRPLLDDPLIEFVGELDESGKLDLMADALGLLFSIDWPEPFGLVMIEAMACGTPVIARPRGAVPEVVADGRTGLFGEIVDDLAAAARRVDAIDRAACRGEVEARFSVRRMVDEYEALYRRLTTAGRRYGA
jgi:glycosyltransferase involved in cell wall biosynthesis